MGQKKQVVFVEPDAVSSFELKGIRIDQLLPKEACCQFSAYRVKMKPHQVKKTSYHKVGEELYYVLDGSGLAVLDGKNYILSKGCFFRVPPKTLHEFITEDDSLDLLNFHSPPVFSDHDTYFED
jgi:mannose-6-phosphate isomerase-like protein (cupin superfamily)